MNGFVAFWRELWEWEHWENDFMVRLLIHVNMLASYQAHTFRGVELERGEFVASYGQIADQMKCSRRKARTGLEALIRCGEITKKTPQKIGTPTGTPPGTPPNVWKVTKYGKFQDIANASGTPPGTPGGTHKNKGIKTNNKKRVKKQEIPTWDEFKTYAIQRQRKVYPDRKLDLNVTRDKYDAWVENGWADLEGRKIKSWKPKVINNLKYWLGKPVNFKPRSKTAF